MIRRLLFGPALVPVLALLASAPFVLATQIAPAQVDRWSLRPVPTVTVSAAEPAVREQLESQRRELEGMLARPDLTAEQLAEVYGATGQLYLLYDLSAAAEACLWNATQIAPETFRWHYQLGALHQLDGRLEAAAQSLQRALELRPRDGATLIRLGQIGLSMKSSGLIPDRQVAEIFGRALPLPGYEAAARFGLGQVAVAGDDSATAAEHYRRALELQPEADIVHYHLAMAYRSLGEEDEMRAHLAERGDNKVRFPDPVAQELQGLAAGVGPLLSLGRASLAIGDVDLALERFREAVALAPESSAAHSSLASALHRKGEIEAAFDQYEEAIRTDPEHAGLRYFVAKGRLDRVRNESQSGDHDQPQDNQQRSIETAVGHLRMALQLEPDFLPGWLELAGAYELLGQPSEGAGALERALAIDASRHDLSLYRAQLLHAAGESAAASAELDRLDQHQRAAGGSRLPDQLVYQVAGLRLELGELAAAEPGLRYLSERAAAPSLRALAHFQLGNLEAGRGEDGAAITAYERAIELAPEMVESHYNLAIVLGRRGRYSDSAAANRRAYELRADHHPARFAEAMALVLAGEHATARTRLEQALERFPNQPSYAHLLARILVAAPDASVRDGMIGVDLSSRLYQALPNPEHAETVAMAFAEIGRFDRAIEWQELLIEKLVESGNQALLERARRYLESYRQQQPIRSPWLERPIDRTEG